jgi:hypothetical protein
MTHPLDAYALPLGRLLIANNNIEADLADLLAAMLKIDSSAVAKIAIANKAHSRVALARILANRCLDDGTIRNGLQSFLNTIDTLRGTRNKYAHAAIVGIAGESDELWIRLKSGDEKIDVTALWRLVEEFEEVSSDFYLLFQDVEGSIDTRRDTATSPPPA